VLRGVAGCWRSGLRKSDFAARFGGEELALILPETGAEGGRQAAEKVRAAIARLRFKAPAGGAPPVGVTVSIGLAAYPEQASRPEDLVALADRALYAAKRAGGDRVADAGG
jgi:diguanylate cyclase (GGDEF)-like protein